MTELLWAGAGMIISLLFFTTYLIRRAKTAPKPAPEPPAIERCRHDSLKFDSARITHVTDLGPCWQVNAYCTLCGQVRTIVTGCAQVEKQSDATAQKRIVEWMRASGWLHDEEENLFIKG